MGREPLRVAGLRVALVSTPFVAVPPARYGGTELIVAELARGLTERGHEVVLFATGDSRAPCTVRSLFPSPRWPPDAFTELAHAGWAARAIRSSRRRFDVVHAHSASFLPFAPMLGGVPVVYTLHHDRDDRLSAFYEQLPRGIRYVAISRRQAGLHPELPATVVHHGLDPDRYRLGPRGEGYLAFLGRLSEVKGPDVAIEVAERLGRELRMGGGVHRAEGDFFDRVLQPLLEKPHVRWLGELAHGPKVELLAGADALLFPIRWDEPFGLVMIEAMFCGCPVIAFRGGSVEEVVEPGTTGFIAEDVDHMVAIVREELPKLDRRKVRERAVERFSCRRMVERYLEVYESAIAHAAGEVATVREVVAR